MLRFKNLFLLAIFALTEVLFINGCEFDPDPEDEEEPTGYTVTITGGTGMCSYLENGDWSEWEDVVSGTTLLYKGDLILLTPTPGTDGKAFSHWTSNGVKITTNAQGYFVMPEANVVLVAVYNNPGLSHIRYTWEGELEDYAEYNINYILASYDDIEWWAINVLGDLNVDIEDFYPGIPGSAFGTGNRDVTETIYDKHGIIGGAPSFATPPAISNPNKGKYFPTKAGKFTAVCGVEDALGNLEIVADYTITVDAATSEYDGEDIWFELFFDVEELVGEIGSALPEDYIKWFEYDNPDDAPYLESPALRSSLSKYLSPLLKKKSFVMKIKTVKLATRSGGTMDVTYYAIRRAK